MTRQTGGTRERIRGLMHSDTGRAGGMAAAVLLGNIIALALTVVFARVLHAKGYGSLSALMSTFVILTVPGTALQTTVAREVSTEIARGEPNPGAAVRKWLERLAVVLLVVVLVSALGRNVLAAIIGVKDVPWAAALTLPSGVLWLMVCVERGALQGFQRYRMVGTSMVGEQVSRLVFGLLMVAVGLGVTGAFLGTPLALMAVIVALAVPLARQIGVVGPGTPLDRLESLFARAWAPVLALGLVAWLQDGHVIIVKHLVSGRQAGAWGASAVAAKAIVWVAIGVSLYLVPETARRARTGEDARPILRRTLLVVGLLALPAILIFAAGAHPLLKTVFGAKFTSSSGALPFLGISMALLATTFLVVQYKLALHRAQFIAVLAVAAVVQPLVLLAIGPHLTAIALGMLAVQAALAATMLFLAFSKAGTMGHSFEEDEAPELVLTEA
ncbi:MAG: lipopolysaccharide biosynthesis protein [Thermoleophilaceae bacterium]